MAETLANLACLMPDIHGSFPRDAQQQLGIISSIAKRGPRQFVPTMAQHRCRVEWLRRHENKLREPISKSTV